MYFSSRSKWWLCTTAHPVFVLNTGTYMQSHTRTDTSTRRLLSSHKTAYTMRGCVKWCSGPLSLTMLRYIFTWHIHKHIQPHNRKHTQHIYKVKQPGNSLLFWNHLLFCGLYILCWNETKLWDTCNVNDLELEMCGAIKNNKIQIRAIIAI